MSDIAIRLLFLTFQLTVHNAKACNHDSEECQSPTGSMRHTSHRQHIPQHENPSSGSLTPYLDVGFQVPSNFAGRQHARHPEHDPELESLGRYIHALPKNAQANINYYSGLRLRSHVPQQHLPFHQLLTAVRPISTTSRVELEIRAGQPVGEDWHFGNRWLHGAMMLGGANILTHFGQPSPRSELERLWAGLVGAARGAGLTFDQREELVESTERAIALVRPYYDDVRLQKDSRLLLARVRESALDFARSEAPLLNAEGTPSREVRVQAMGAHGARKFLDGEAMIPERLRNVMRTEYQAEIIRLRRRPQVQGRGKKRKILG